MFAGKDRLIEQIEKSLLPTIDVILIAQFQLGRLYDQRIGIDHTASQRDVDVLQRSHLLSCLELLHQLANLIVLLVWILNRLLGYLLPSKLIKIIRDSRHQHQLGNEQGGVIVFLVFGNQQRLLQIFDSYFVFLLVVTQQTYPILQFDVTDLFVVDVLDFVVSGLAVIGHDDLVDQLILHHVPSLLSILVLVDAIQLVDVLQHSLIAHDLFD
jgi:hypothetical protein